MLAPFVRFDRGSVHPVIDLQALATAYPAEAADQERIDNVTSAFDLFCWEHLRRRFDIGSTERRPVDVFVWAEGEPADPRCTKIGGRPFWPVRLPWPRLGGKPATFLCQFDFRDSRDLLPPLPGDILAIFVSDEHICGEWVPGEQCDGVWLAADECDVIDPGDVPPPAWTFFHGYGVRARTWDDSTQWVRSYELDVERNHWLLPVHRATKIGGVAWDAQTIHVESEVYGEGERLLCQLSSVQPPLERSWPWANRAAPIPRQPPSFRDTDQLMVGDMGAVAFLLARDGSVRAWSSCS